MNVIRERFERIAREFIKRDGLEDLLARLRNTDFYSAPASTKYHHSIEGGLAIHTLEVFDHLITDLKYEDFDKESVAIVSLFHDVCKIGFYKTEMRNTKDDKGKWIQVPFYTVEDNLPYGHGEKSVYMVSDVMKLTTEESMAIRWHMGLGEPKENYMYVQRAFAQFPLTLYLHIADMKSSFIDWENREEK